MTIKSSLRNSVRNVYNIFQFVVGEKELWRGTWERDYIKHHWGNVTSQPDFEEKFLNLIKGLDAQSVSIVNQILARQKAILASHKMFLDLYTTDEKQRIREIKENLNDQILQISDDLFAWKNYLLPINHFEASVFYYKHGREAIETLDRVRGKTIMDVGGFIGDSELVFDELAPYKIYTFEASPINFELMKKTLEINGLKNVIAENFALGAEKGECTLSGTGSGTKTVKGKSASGQNEIRVLVMTLDDYVAEHKIENIALIKVDIEGAEPDFLAGAKKTICAQKPILLLSIYHNAHDFFELKPLIESWNLGYKFKIYKPVFHNVCTETLLIAEIV